MQTVCFKPSAKKHLLNNEMKAPPEIISSAENWNKIPVKEVGFTYKWIINCSQGTADYLTSPTFSAINYDQYKWRLRYYPSSAPGMLYVCLALELVSNSNAVINYRCSLLNNKSERIQGQLRKGTQFSQGCRHSSQFIFGRALDLPKNTLTILCDITMQLDTITEQPDYEHKLSQDLGHLFENETFKDVTLIVADAEIKAHKIILSARSVVFEAMFTHDMNESISNRVTITDISYEVLQEMLRFIYTGKISNIDNIADQLIMAAEKYALMDLKKLCEIELCNKFSVETAADMLILADLYSADYLKAQTVEFISVHFKEVLKTQGWKNIITSHTHLITDTVEAAWSTASSKRT